MARITLFLNTRNFAASQFLNHPANSACVFNGKLLFATSNGIFESSGDNDGYTTVDDEQVPVDINAYFVLPTTDFEYQGQKSPRSIVLGGRFTGQMQVSVSDEQSITRDYVSDTMSNTDGVKIALRSDQRSRYLTVKIGNVNGTDFAVDSADIIFIAGPERRR